MNQIGMKRGKIEEKILGKFGRNVQKNEEKAQKIPKLINAQDVIIAQGGFFLKTMK